MPTTDEAASEPRLPGGTGQWFDSADGQHWWFDSGCLSLDFAYTGAMVSAGEGERVADTAGERLKTPADLEAWLHERFPTIDSTCAEHELRDALTLRGAIANLAYAALGGRPYIARDVDIVNLYASTPDLPPVLAGGSRQAGRTRARASQALSVIARDAVAVFGADAGDRLRECGADDCSIVYLDVSRSRNRRWCSMQRCGNRAKVRAHRARQAASEPAGTA
ncbi:MAG TPA: CGNR zinc finger domain-containing protein [Humibacter sp.]|nr:CGNR zinc finger domain-containing protein [Humibacter sp.]